MKKQGKLQRKLQREKLAPIRDKRTPTSKKHKNSLESCQSALGSTTAVTSSAAASVTTKGRKISEVIDKNQCCICYCSFADDEREESGLEWVECICTRWLHEECIDYDIEVNADGRELLCPYCVL